MPLGCKGWFGGTGAIILHFPAYRLPTGAFCSGTGETAAKGRIAFSQIQHFLSYRRKVCQLNSSLCTIARATSI